jgi:hypothetical protein
MGDHWASEVLTDSEKAGFEFDETLNQIFRFRSQLTNFIKGCPLELVEDVYCSKVIASVVQVFCTNIEHARSLLTCVQKHGLAHLLL